MDYNIRTIPECQREIDITFPVEEVAPRLEEEYKTLRKDTQLHGFRKGKIPMQLIKKLFKKRVEASIFNELVSNSYKEIIKNCNFTPITQPKVEQLDYNEKNGLAVKLSLEIQPEVELKEYKGIEVEKRITRVTEKSLERALDNLRYQNAMILNVEDGAKPGNTLVVDLQELDMSGVPIIGKKLEHQYIVLPDDESNQLVRQLVGVKAGENRRVLITTTGSQGQPLPESRGQLWDVLVTEVFDRQLPELDDEFAKDLGEYKNLNHLKEKLKEELILSSEINAIRTMEHQLIDEIIKRNNVELPGTMIDNYLDLLVQEVREKNKERAIDEKLIRENNRHNAIEQLKWTLLREKIIAAENLAVTDEELAYYIDKLKQAGGKQAELAESYQGDKLENLRSNLLNEKLIELLKQNATIKETVVEEN